MIDRILQRIADIPVLPESRAALSLIVERDWHAEEAVQDRLRCEVVFEAIYRAFGGQANGFQPFLAAWLILRAALLRLDHLQDNDVSEPALPSDSLSAAEQYNLIFTYYVLATALLDDLDDTIILPRRIRHLTRLWNDTMLWAGSGQQRDLAKSGPTDQPEAVLSHYQEMIQAKAGAVYGLGFGGVAALTTDDLQTVGVISTIGQIYGTLLQFSDDFLDASGQLNPWLTLPEAYRRAAIASGMQGQSEHLSHYWNFILRSYMEQVERMVIALPGTVRSGLLELFHNTFDVQT